MAPRSTAAHPLTLISAQLDGEISPGESRFLSEHLESCADCRRKETGLRAVAAGLRELPVPEPPAGALDRLVVLLRDTEVREVIPPEPVTPQAVAESEPPRPPRARRAKWHSALVAAAAVCVAVPAWFLLPKSGALSEPGPAALSSPVDVAPQAPEAPNEPALAEVAPLVPESQAPSDEGRHAARTAPPAAPSSAAKLSPSPSAPAAAPSVEPTPVQVSNAKRHEPGPVWVDPAPLSFKGDTKRLSREARERVQDLAAFLLAHPEIHLAIRGYTDERRSTDRTLALGQKRAEKIARQLAELGVDESRLRVESLPIDRPVKSDLDGQKGTPEDRVEFRLEPRDKQAHGKGSSGDPDEAARESGVQ